MGQRGKEPNQSLGQNQGLGQGQEGIHTRFEIGECSNNGGGGGGGEGQGMIFIREKGENGNGKDTATAKQWILLGAGSRSVSRRSSSGGERGGGERGAGEIKKTGIIGIKGVMWEVEIGGVRWGVGVEWVVLR